ncbi:MAG: hypothetical protein M3Y56_06440 [Armatimonadota bacterium]|nr:hypothetical protein [Armatimonadota bacterium]
MTKKLVLGSVLAAGSFLGLSAFPAAAVPDASSPNLLGVAVGAEAGVSGARSGIPYYVYATGGVAHFLALKGELLGGSDRPTMKLVSGQFSVLPLPFVSVVAEPGITGFGNAYGPSLGVRATGSLPIKLRVTGYARVHYVHSRATTEIGAGIDYPIFSMLNLSVSAMRFNGGNVPDGTLFLVGVKSHIGF